MEMIYIVGTTSRRLEISIFQVKILINMLIFFVLLITLSGIFPWEAALLSASFVALILAFLLSYLELVAWWVVGLFLAIILIMIMYIMWSKREPTG